MKKKTKLGILTCAMTTAFLSTSAFASQVIEDIKNAADEGGGQFKAVNDSVNKFSGNLIIFILSLVVAVVLIGLAITLLAAAFGGQREKENVKGKVVWAIICLALATPASFYGIAGMISRAAGDAANSVGGGGNGGGDQNLGGFNDQAPVKNIEEAPEYSVYL